MEDIKQTVGKQIREARKAKGMTLKELGKRMGVTEGAASRYETGMQNLSLETLVKIADALEMTFTVIIK